MELSRATAANWAAKTANWLVDELDVEPGTPVLVDLPAHWQSAGVFLGSWWCGAHVVDTAEGAEVAFVPANEPTRGRGARTVAALGLDALGAPLRNPDPDVVDYISEIRTHGDDFTPIPPIDGSTQALLEDTVDGALQQAAERARALGLRESDRVMSTLDWKLPGGVLDGLLAVLSARASLVQCANPDPDQWERRKETEKVTTELGTGS